VLAPVGYLAGLNIVKECLRDDVISKYVYMVMYKELITTLDLPQKELKKFANDVVERFNNPFVHHFLTSIMLNSFPKFKTRDLPGLKIYLERKGELPVGLVLGLAAIITYYKGGKRGNTDIVPNDDKAIVDLLKILWTTNNFDMIAQCVLAAEFIWGENLNEIPGLTDKLSFYLKLINEFGMKETVRTIVSNRFNLSVKMDFELPHFD
jgi:tagaturonate reductase